MDGGANNGLAGSNVVRVSDFYPSGNISIVDASDNVNSALSDLKFADCAAVITRRDGARVLGMFSHVINCEKGKSILCRSQVVASGHQVDEISRLVGV